MNPNIHYQSRPANSEAREIKQIMLNAIENAHLRDPRITKKSIALDLRLHDTPSSAVSTLSHYLSFATDYTLPVHLVPLFCRLVGDWTLSRSIQPKYHKRVA